MANIFLDSFNAHGSQYCLAHPKTRDEQRELARIAKESGKLRGKLIGTHNTRILHTDSEESEYRRRMEQHAANRRNVKVSLAQTPWG